MKNLITAALMALATPAAALDLTPDAIGFSGLSWHGERAGYVTPEGERRRWNEINIGVSLTYDVNPAHSVTLSAFHNSFDGLGTAIVVDQTWFRGESWDVGFFSGLAHYPTYGAYQVTNYGHIGEQFEDVFLVGGFRARVQNFEVRYTPPEGGGTSFASVSYVFDLNRDRQKGSIYEAAQYVWGPQVDF